MRRCARCDRPTRSSVAVCTRGACLVVYRRLKERARGGYGPAPRKFPCLHCSRPTASVYGYCRWTPKCHSLGNNARRKMVYALRHRRGFRETYQRMRKSRLESSRRYRRKGDS